MGDNKIYTGFHSTSKDFAIEILSNGFKIPCIDSEDENSKQEKFFKHWLGTGVYFYEDVDVAKWWSSKPSKTFGADGEHMILQSSLSPKKVLDLRKVSAWKELIKDFDLFCKHIGKNLIVNLPDTIPSDKDSEEYKNYIDTKHQLRCMFFDWLHMASQIDMVIAAFNQEEFDYFDNGDYKIETYLDLFYTEVQYCVYDPKVIQKTEKFKKGEIT